MKKRLLRLFFGLIIIVAIVLVLLKFFETKNTENSSIKNKFQISKIHLYSSVNANNNKTTYQNPEWNLDIYQYTDIAIYVKRLEEYSNENYIKSVYLDDFEISDNSLSNKKIFYLDPLEFGSAKSTLETEVTGKLEYNVVNAENKEDDMTYGIPIFFEDCSNPITIRYVNDKIVQNYKIDSNEQVEFNGSLLKMANIELNELYTTITFTLNIVTKDDEVHTVKQNIEIPLKDNGKTIYDDNIDITNQENIEL